MMIKDHSFSHSVGCLCDSSDVSIPEEFLDPITQEVMMLPMLLPSGVSVDNTTLEEHQKREATWGRPPNDPFTGVPFSSTSQPLPNPHLKTRIDHFLLQKGVMSRAGMLGRQGDRENPQASRLVASTVDGKTGSLNHTVVKSYPGSDNTKRTPQLKDTGLGHSSDRLNHTSQSQPLAPDSNSVLGRGSKRQINGESRDGSMTENQLLPQTKRQRKDACEYNMISKCFFFSFFLFCCCVKMNHASVPSCSSHEQLLSASLDEALFSALQGRPSFTSSLSLRGQITSDSTPPNATLTVPTGRISPSVNVEGACLAGHNRYISSEYSINLP